MDNRIIEFKAIRIDYDPENQLQNEWVYGYYRKFSHCMPGLQFTNHIIVTETGVHYEIFPETVCQYIGLKDKKRTESFPNGQKIYENDIVDKGYCQLKSFICFTDGMYFTRGILQSEEEFISNCVDTNEECMTFICQCRADNMEVIGNRFDNYESKKNV